MLVDSPDWLVKQAKILLTKSTDKVGYLHGQG